MQRIIEHTNLIERLKKYKIDFKFISNFELDDLHRCCNNLEYNKISDELYVSSQIIQEELIIDEKFVDYLIEISNKEISLENLENLLSKIQENNEKISDYNLNNVIDTLKNEKLNSKTYYDYLKYFSNNIKSVKEKNIIADNLEYFSNQNSISISELDDNERSLFNLSVMSDYNLIPIHNIKKVCEFLVQDIELKNIILFLFDNNLKVHLNIKHYELITENSKEIYKYIYKLSTMIDNEQMYQLLLKWVGNCCNVYDLKILEEKLHHIEKSEIESIFYNRSTYINFIFKNKISKILLQQLSEIKENILIYAIHHNKKSFIKLIEDNQQEFINIPDRSLLFNKDVYSKYLNINTLTLNNLVELQIMYGYDLENIFMLKENIYTFEEIKLLYNEHKNYIKFYNCLLDLKIDIRMLIIKQLLKKDLLNKYLEDNEIEKLAEKLKIKNLYNWLENDFSHINQVTAQNVVDILINYDNIKKFIPQISNQKELLYILRNIEKIQQYESVEKIKEDIEEIDKYWKAICKNMFYSDNFIKANKNHIKEFLLNNGAELALTYYENCKYFYKEPYKRIIKSELMGEFKKLKYYADDLEREIDTKLCDYQIKEWTENNSSIKDGIINVAEYDDFYSTMILGEQPQHTCLSYKNGRYNECLLACFDSNKKILYAKVNEKIVARAMIRLTKGTFSNYNNKTNDKFSFVDLENINDKQEEKLKTKEYLTVFLENPYISGISPEQGRKIKKMFIKLLEDKAKKMNALLVLSSAYENIEESKEYILTKYYMYISKSKAGSQYLDSLNGQATITDEGQYRMNRFLILQNQDIT